MKKIFLASNNAGKEKEFNNILAKFGISVVSMRDYNIESPAETGLTFIENAIIKARHGAKITNMPALADDSGLVVRALNGAPGIYSSRFSGTKDDKQNCLYLLQKLQNISDRSAYFFSCLVLLKSYDDPAPTIATGIWHGKIADSLQGNQGFGYDPIFIPDEYMQNSKLMQNTDKTAAMLSSIEKNASSHRAKAIQNLLEQMDLTFNA